MLLALAACGPRDRCVAPSEPKTMSAKDMTLDQKADALGVPPSQVPSQPASAPSYDALVQGMHDNSSAEAVYERYAVRHNDEARANVCLDNEAYKARAFKDEMSTVAHAVMATCNTKDEQAALATILKYRNCALGNN
jgi:hypothetical protein